jgi:hypothetical protein
LEKITLLCDEILDGVNRYNALRLNGIDSETIRKDYCVEHQGDTPALFVLSKNLHRRHLNLTDSQRAMLVADMETYKHGGNRKNQDGSIHVETRTELAKAAEVSSSSVARAKQIKESSPEDAQDIRAGKTTIGTVTKKLRKATKGKPKSKEPIESDSTQAEPIPSNATQPNGEVPADSASSECVQSSKGAWWHNPDKGLYRRVDAWKSKMVSPLEMVQYAIDDVQRAIDEKVLESKLAGLQKIRALALAGGVELTEDVIDSLLWSDISEDTWEGVLNDAVESIEGIKRNVLQTWNRIQTGSTNWTPFDGLPSYRKGKLDVMDIIKAVTHVLSSAGWNAERITETLITLTGNDTTPCGIPMGEEVDHHVLSRANDKWNDRTVKGFREVRKWLREWKGIDIPEA